MREITLTQNKIAIVDDEDFDYLNQFTWFAHKAYHTYYAARMLNTDTKRIRFMMHCDITKNKGIDHIDGNGLNNQKSNLRIASRTQNGHNRIKRKNATSKFKGVSWHKRDKIWQARIRINKKLKYIGYFNTEIDAAKAYDIEAKKAFGEFAKVNFP